VIGENETFLGGEAYLKQRGIEVVNMRNKKCQDLMEKFIKEKPEVWYVDSPGHVKYSKLNLDRNEDIGEEERVHSKEAN
jgi:cytosine deaminase